MSIPEIDKEVYGETLLVRFGTELNCKTQCAIHQIRQISEDVLEKIPEDFPMADFYGKVSEESCVQPFTADIERGLKGELPWNEEMDELGDALASDAVPQIWASKAYPSLLPLGSWFSDLLQRYRALHHWVSSDFALPPTMWLGGLFSPQSFLTAVIQTSGRKHDLPLDKLSIHCEVTKKCRTSSF
ncbi:dynein heavy chain 17, axonemal [Caerostris extrusa]|uniref:Dynein heavy chain 17, axonemal n=1 Tax=Caerostris extrusa TaxID=172846 RepID=A0AAV4V6W4_CAEEX|nr:dynein heavy chain 17, axonemal [Caerostris extrusa]